MKYKTPNYLLYGLPAIWMVFTLSLSTWWMVNGLMQASRLREERPNVEQMARQSRMFLWEGGFLVGVVFLGGLALFYLIYADAKRNEELRRFFSSFTHEIKTSLTSMRLQAEILDENPSNRENSNLQRLLRDIVRLDLQLENALIIAQADRNRLFLEDLALSKIIESLSVHWPSLKINIVHDSLLHCDRRAIDCIIKNILQNSVVHGKASSVNISAEEKDNSITLSFSDNGQGSLNPEKIGKVFHRHSNTSGSGIGLYLSRLLAKQMGGNIQLSSEPGKNFNVLLSLKGKKI